MLPDGHAASDVRRRGNGIRDHAGADAHHLQRLDGDAAPHLHRRPPLAEGAGAQFRRYSIGKWVDADGDGRFDTLEIETRFVKGPRTWDQTGLPMADDSDAVFKERLFLDKANLDVLHDEITTTDNSLTRPWTVMKSYRRGRNTEWVEMNCGESNNYVTIENQVYYIGGDGLLMPLKKGQPAPNLRYFK
jgi:hypothetical protein